MSEYSECFECGSKNLVHDYFVGEVVCGDCGVVLGEVEFAPPPERVPKVESKSCFSLTSFSVGTSRFSSQQRTEANVVYDIDRLVSKLDLPFSVEQAAVVFMRKLLRLMREQKGSKIRLSRSELAVLSVWNAVKLVRSPLTIVEFNLIVKQVFGKVENVVKLETRASRFASMVPLSCEPACFVSKLRSKLEGILPGDYLSKVTGYAFELIRVGDFLVKNRRPVLVAAAAIFAVDDLSGKQLSAPELARLAKVGMSSMIGLAFVLKSLAPVLPGDFVLFKFHCSVAKELRNFVKA